MQETKYNDSKQAEQLWCRIILMCLAWPSLARLVQLGRIDWLSGATTHLYTVAKCNYYHFHDILTSS